MMAETAGPSRRLATGALTVAAGLTVTGLGTIVMMALSARSLPAPEYAAFAVWWTLSTLLGMSFGVFESYLARLVVADVAAGRDSRRVTGLMLGRAMIGAAAVAGVLLGLAPWLASRLLDGNLAAALLVPVYVMLAGGQALQRGSATGHGRFSAIAGQLVTDGLARAGLSVALIATGRDSQTSLALGACLAAAASLLVGSRMWPRWLARPRIRDKRVSNRPVGYLLIGAVGPLLANNASVPWLAGTHSVNAYTLGAFAGAVTLSRLPMQFVSAAFAPLLTQLSHCVETDDESTFRRLLRLAEVSVWGLGLVFVAGFTVLGPWVLGVYLGPGYDLSVAALATLAVASGLMFVAFVQQASLAAMDRWSMIAMSWACGAAMFLLVLVLPLNTLARATAAPLAAVLTALAVMTITRPKWTVVARRGDAARLPGEGRKAQG